MTAVYAWTTRDVVTVQGDDAASYLQGQVSQDVAALAVGEAAPTFVLAPQGKVDGWGRIHRVADDAFEIDVDPGAGAGWEARLRRFLLRTKAEVGVAEGVEAVSVRGIAAPEGFEATALPALGPGVVGFDVVGAGDREAVAALDGLVEVDEGELEALRIRAGVPRWGAELDADTIPATVGQWAIDSSVSFTKGCYTGQELVARIDSRGGNVPRRLVGLVVEGPPPAPGTAVVVDGAEVGTTTSSAADAAASAGSASEGSAAADGAVAGSAAGSVGGSGGRSVALAYLPRSIEVGPDGVPATVAGTPATVRTLPLP